MLDAVTDQLHLLDMLGAVCLTRLQARNASGRHDYTVTGAEFPCWFAPPACQRRPARDCERLPETGEAMVHAAMSRIMLRRIAA